MKLKLAVTLLSAAALFAYAQPFGRGRAASTTAGTVPSAPPVDAVKTYLTLTDSQITGFQAIRQTAQTSAQPIHDQLRTKMEALRTARNATPVNNTTVAAIQAEITALEAQLTKIQTDATNQMKALLSADQKTKLATLEAAAALREQVQGASMIGLIAGGPGGPGGRGFGRGKGKGGRF